MNIKEQIGQRILQERKAKGLTQAALAKLAGDLKQPRINNWERGIRTPGLEEINQIAKVLEVSAAYLMCMSNKKNLHPLERNHVGDLVPLLNHKQAYEANYWIESIKQEEYDGDVRFIPIDIALVKNFGKNNFAVQVLDESMIPELLKNDILIINSELIPKPGNFVLAAIDNNNEEIIIRRYRQLSVSNLEYELLPINQNWPQIKNSKINSCNLLGTVIQVIRTYL